MLYYREQLFLDRALISIVVNKVAGSVTELFLLLLWCIMNGNEGRLYEKEKL